MMFLLSLLRSRGMTLLLVVLVLGAAGQGWRIIALETRNQRLVTQNTALIRERDSVHSAHKRYVQQTWDIHKTQQETEYAKHQATLSSDKLQTWLHQALADDAHAGHAVPDGPAQRLYQHAEAIRKHTH